MTEDEARDQIARHVPRETFDRLDLYTRLLIEEAAVQNLVSAASLPTIWQRHILDSAQLARLDTGTGRWLDIGSGAGLPGLVVAIVSDRPVTLVEPRTLRVRFLERCIAELGLGERTEVIAARAHSVRDRSVAVISARAVAGVAELFAMAAHLATPETRWILPRGRSAQADVAAAGQLWHADCELVPSVTDSEAAIVVATDVRPRKRR